MEELSLHLLDLIQNSVKAGASLVEIIITEKAGLLTIILEDNGCGMSEEFLQRVESPFTTTRTTRKVGLGIPLFKQAALMAGGDFSITSAPGKGTRIVATFQLDNIDRAPMGDLAGTMLQQVMSTPVSPDYRLEYTVGEDSFEFDTRQIRELLGGVALDSPDVVIWMKDYLTEGIRELNGGA
ncbi:MAG: ATP-binding protein [Candidatus Fimadaptatus sp.]|jgi:anti-sigma regulatory factor (Ser/Thr protein kinase)